MHSFSVWAPRVRSCSVLVGAQSYPMTPAEGGWWFANVESASHGTDYQFLLNDDTHPYPDPRSAWQPEGVHGPSRVVDQSLFSWSDPSWSALPLGKAVIYELHVGTFTPAGTFDAAIDRLTALRELGITHVELMPVNSFPGRWGWGYDGAEIFAPQEEYGGPDGLKRLVDACHTTGLAVLLDVVYNHFGPMGNYNGLFGPYITEKHHTPWGGAINFDDAGSLEVRRFFCDNALMWLRDYHFDGLRLDAIHAYVDDSPKHFLEQLSEEVEELSTKLGRSLVLIAESDLNDPKIVTPRGEAKQANALPPGYGIDAQWSDDFHHALFAFLTGERQSYYRDFGSLAQLAKSLRSAYVFDGVYSNYRNGNFGQSIQDLSAHRFLGYIQNHDQIGNRPLGNRLHDVVGMRKAKLAAALVFTAPFVPMIFQGEEFAASSPFLYFADHDDPQLARAVSEGRRREHSHDVEPDLIPDPELEETFLLSKLDWEEREVSPHREMLDWHRTLIELRRLHEELTEGNLGAITVRYDEAASWLVFERGRIQLMFNFGAAEFPATIEKQGELLVSSDAGTRLEGSTVILPAETFAAIRLLN